MADARFFHEAPLLIIGVWIAGALLWGGTAAAVQYTPTITPTNTLTTPTVTPTCTATPVLTATATATATPYAEEFSYSDDVPPSSPGQTPASWIDSSTAPGCNATFHYAATDGLAQLEEVTNAELGRTYTQQMQVDLSQGSILQVTVNSVPAGKLMFGIYKGTWDYSCWEACAPTFITQPGTYSYDLTRTGLSGLQTFGVVLEASGLEYGMPASAVVDAVRIGSTALDPPATIWVDDFNGASGSKPAAWQDAANTPAFHAMIFQSPTASVASVTRTAGDVWGKVLSPNLRWDVSRYNIVEVKVNSISANAAWKLGIQEMSGAYQYWDLNNSCTAPGLYQFDYGAVTGWTTSHLFRIQFTVEGAEGAKADVDWIRVGESGSVHGASAGRRQVSGVICAPTLQATATPIPGLAAGAVRAYPNPARDRVNFAYTLSGPAKVVIDIYKISGERVAHIMEHRDGGVGQTLTTAWQAAGVAPGIYLCRIVITDDSGREVMNVRKKVALVR